MAIKFLSGLNLSNVTAGSILKLDSNGNIVAATAGTDYVASSLWTTTSSDIYRNSSVRIGTYQTAIAPDARLHVFDYQTTTPKLLIEDGNTGDASMQFKISTQQYTMGIDNSDSDKFVFAASSALGTTNALEISTTGTTTFKSTAYFEGDAYFNADGQTFYFTADDTSRTTLRWQIDGSNKYVLSTVGANSLYWGRESSNTSGHIELETPVRVDGSLTVNTDSYTNTITTGHSGTLNLIDTKTLLLDDSFGTNNGRVFGVLQPAPFKPSDITLGDSAYATAATGSDVTNTFPNVKGEADATGITSNATFTFAEALAQAETLGGRLPTLEEVLAGVGAGSGQGYDAVYLWTQTKAGHGKYWVAKGDGDNQHDAIVVDINASTPPEYSMRIFYDISKDNMPVYYDNSSNIRTKSIKAESSSGIVLKSDGDIVGLTVKDNGNLGFNQYGTGILQTDSSGNVTSSTTLSEAVYFTYTGASLIFSGDSEGSSYAPVESGVASTRYWLRFDTTNNASYPYLTNRTPSGDVAIFTGTASGGAENEHFRIKGGDGTVDAYFTNANVGIGTTSPDQELEVVGTIQATSAGTATLILRGDSGNSGDTGQLDSTIKMLHDDGTHGILLETRNYASAQSFEIKSLVSGTETSRFLIDTDGTLKIPAYGAGFLTTDANGDVSVDTSTYLTSVDWSDIGSINGIINLNSTTLIGQGDTETLVSFQNSGTERGRFEVDDSANSYFVATGFKTATASTGFLKADGTVDTSTYLTSTDVTSFIEITDVATYLSTNNYITTGYTGFDSRYVLSSGGFYDEDFTWDGTHEFQNVLKVTGDITIQKGHGDLTLLTLKQEDTTGDLVVQKSFIDFTFVDSNTNETPQVRIGAEVGNNDGSASSLAEEGMGAFVVYTNNADTDAGAAGTSLAERFRVDRQGRVGIGSSNPAATLHVDGSVRFEDLTSGILKVDANGDLSVDTNTYSTASGVADNADNYGSWTVSDGTNTEAITSGTTVAWRGSGATSVSYDASTNQFSISSTNTEYSNATTSTAGLMSSTDKSKLDGIASGAEVNVQADWNETGTTSDAFIKNKPTLGTAAASAATDFVAVSGDTMTGTLALDNADSLSFESGKHWITYNDGEGNFNIRVGHKSDSTPNEVSTETGYAFHDEWSQSSGWREFNVSGTSITAGDDVGTWRRQMYYDYNDVQLAYQGSVKFKTTNTGITVTGEIATTGGNSTNWNTAYGWGNHADGGYLTTASAASTYATTDHGHSDATQEASGFMSSTDKTKLDGIATGADVTPSWVPSSDPSYLTSYTETDTLSSVVSRGASTTTAITTGGITATYGHFGGTSTAPQVRIYTENASASIADTFADTTTDKSYIYFMAGTNSNDPGYIMHETSENASPDERNEGVLHLVPSDDNSTGDYVSIHGTNDADVLKLHTSGLIETATGYQLVLKSGNASVKVDDTLHVTGRLYVDTLDANTSSTSALVEGSSGEIEKRTLGSLAFDSTTLGTAASQSADNFVSVSGDEMTGDLEFRNNVSEDNAVIRNIEFNTSAAQGTDDRVAIIRAYTSGGTAAERGGQMNFYTRKPSAAGFNNMTYDNAGNLYVPSNVYSNSSQLATQSYVTTAISNLVDSAPAALDTLNELAAALGDDASFSTTMSTALGNRLRIDVNNQSLSSTELSNARTNLGLGTAATSAATDFVAVSGDTMTGDLTVNGGDVTIAKQNDAPTITLLHDGTNPSTNDLLFKMQFQSDYNGTHENWGKIELDTNSSAVRTNMDFYVKSTAGAEQLGFRIEGGSSTPKAYFYNDVTVDGELRATAKSFDIEHPTKEGKRLVYGSLEGAEHGVYFRGKGTGEVIELPEHWTGLVHEDSITVQLTPIGKNCVWVEDIKDNAIHVGMDNDTPYFYFIQGERKDIDKLIVEQDA